MQTSRAQALRLPARSILVLLGAIGLLLGGSPLASTHSSGIGLGFDASVRAGARVTAGARVAASAKVGAGAKISAARSSIVGLPQSHGAAAFRLQRAILVRQLAARGGPQLAISFGPVLPPAAALLELERLTRSAARGVLRFVRPGRGPPQQAGT
jgi:hypothetical protein